MFKRRKRKTAIHLLKAFVVPAVLLSFFALVLTGLSDQNNRPWMNPSLSPDRRAELLLDQMTLDEKIQIVHGHSPYDRNSWDRWAVMRAFPASLD